MKVISGASRLIIAALIGVVIFAVAVAFLPALVAAPLGLAAMGFSFSLLSFSKLWPMSPQETRDHAERENYFPGFEESIAVLTGLGALGLVAALFYAHLQGEVTTIGALCSLGAISGSWLMLHLVYAAQYAALYYTEQADAVARDDSPAIDFHSKRPPRYVDFIYFAITIGMSFAVSDSDVGSTNIRAVIVRHSLGSYLFGTLLLATMINVLASLLAA